MIYTISHRAIAAAVMVTDQEGREHACYFMAEGTPVQEGVSGSAETAEKRFLALPEKVRSAVEYQFRQVFALATERREDWLKAQVPYEVEV